MSIRTQKEAIKNIIKNTEDNNKKKELQHKLNLLSQEENECLKNMGVEL